MSFQDSYRGRRVLVTGHTGFKGSWLCEWLLSLGAEVHGYALDPEEGALLFDQLGLARRLASDSRADLSDRLLLARTVLEVRPDYVFHLAAQPLVRLSYRVPVETFATNVMGTVHLLEALRELQSAHGHACVAVIVTTDKCYENREWLHAYREEDALGGHDPYSASKAAAELVVACYRSSFLSGKSGVRVASARAGNVIGGGDWAADRIIPDCMRAWRRGQPVAVRHRSSTRPWQHVLEPLGGYLHLAASIAARGRGGNRDQELLESLCSAFNFGPGLASNRPVGELVEGLARHTGGRWVAAPEPGAVHEASKLNLATGKAFHLLGWQPVWGFETALARTAEWYLGEAAGESVQDLTRGQIRCYVADGAAKRLPWAAER